MSLLHRIRRNERRLARGVLALFGLVWLQIAAVPCGAMHATPTAGHRHEAPGVHGPARAGQGDETHATQASHGAGEHSHHAAPDSPAVDAATGDAPCPWCPPADDDAGCADDGSRCAFPHAPQVDARLPGLFLPPPEAPAYPARPELATCVLRSGDERPEPVPRYPLTIGYCRFIE